MKLIKLVIVHKLVEGVEQYKIIAILYQKE